MEQILFAVMVVSALIAWINYWRAYRRDSTLSPIMPDLLTMWRNPNLRVSVLVPMLIGGGCIVLIMFIWVTRANS